jgi:DnaK suppressor protein
MDPDRARELLQRERERIEQALKAAQREPSEELADIDQHQADTATELFEDERDASITEQLREELAAIERAEKRLEEGTYGLSIESGKPIEDARLEIVPWAERTVAEQAEYDARHQA